jgi:hypothetical protein
MKQAHLLVLIMACFFYGSESAQAQNHLYQSLGAPYVDSTYKSHDRTTIACVVNEAGVRNIWFTEFESLVPQKITNYNSDDGPEREADRMLTQGILLRDHRGRFWGASLLLPIRIGITSFLLDGDFSLSSLSTLAIVPTFEFVIPINDRWTMEPFAGLGVAWTTGAVEVIGSKFLMLATAGLRITRWQNFSDRYWFGLTGNLRYDEVLSGRNGPLGDWGNLEVAVELRRSFGQPREGARFMGGLYLQGRHFWDPVEISIPGITTDYVYDQLEAGVSLGTDEPYKLLGITLPRVFVGYFFSKELRGVRLHFVRL